MAILLCNTYLCLFPLTRTKTSTYVLKSLENVWMSRFLINNLFTDIVRKHFGVVIIQIALVYPTSVLNSGLYVKLKLNNVE